MAKDTKETPAVFVRSEDMDHPKLPKLARIVTVQDGKDGIFRALWIAWGAGLTREWLLPRLEGKGHVLILPPWPATGFAGLPAVRLVSAPAKPLVLEKTVYHVAALQGMEEDNAWKAEGCFESSRIAWLVSHEPFAGAGKAWLCMAELLLANPNSRPKDVRALTAHIIRRLDAATGGPARSEKITKENADATSISFTAADAPYLLALLVVKPPIEAEALVRIVRERFMISGDMDMALRILSDGRVLPWMEMPLEQRKELFRIIDALGFRSYRLELMEANA